MIKNVEKIVSKYNVRQFQCDNINCNYIITPNEADDYTVDDIKFCPSCGREQGDAIREKQELLTLRAFAFKAMETIDSEYDDTQKEIFCKGAAAVLTIMENTLRTLEETNDKSK